MRRKVVITASGGGHTGYAVAIAQRLSGKAELAFVVPEGDLWSASKVRLYGRVTFVKKARGPNDMLIKALPGLLKACIQSALRVPSGFHVLVSSGSNHSIPPALVARAKGMKVVNIESSVRFTRPSTSARLLRPLSHLTALQWPEQEELLPGGVLVGPIFEKPAYRPEDRGYILVTGGTYGHRRLFNAILKLNLERVVMQTGTVDPTPYKMKKPSWIVFRFDPDFAKWLAGATVVISHLGKTVIDAALTYRKPVIIVPNTEWKYTAGWRDAELLAEKLNAVLVRNVSPEVIRRAIREAEGRRPPKYEDGGENLAKLILKGL